MFFQPPRSSSRRLLFSQERRTVAQRPQPSRAPSSFYNRVTTVSDSPERFWQPGEHIPSGTPPVPTVDFQSLVSEMQSSISSELSKIQGTLSLITDRLSNLEESVALNTAKLSSQPSCSMPVSTPSTSSSESSGNSRKRKRHVPTEISVSKDVSSSCIIISYLQQNLVRTIHNNLPEEKRLKKNEK